MDGHKVTSKLQGRVYALVSVTNQDRQESSELTVGPTERGGISIFIGDDIDLSLGDPADWDRIDAAVREVLAVREAATANA